MIYYKIKCYVLCLDACLIIQVRTTELNAVYKAGNTCSQHTGSTEAAFQVTL